MKDDSKPLQTRANPSNFRFLHDLGLKLKDVKFRIFAALLTTVMISCSEGGKKIKSSETVNYHTVLQIDSITDYYDKLMKEKMLTKYHYQNKSYCGGDLYGYFQDSTLFITDATSKAELGFSSQKIYWNKESILKIVYREHFAEWDKYEKKYPSNKYEWDPGKMTYTDTLYKVTLGIEYKMQKYREKI